MSDQFSRRIPPSGTSFLTNSNFSSADPYELFVPPILDHAYMGPQENMQSQFDFVPEQLQKLSLPDTFSNPTYPLPRGNRPMISNLPTLTLQTESIQGRNTSYSSRRPSWQSSISSIMPSQVTGTERSYATRFSPFSSIQTSFGTPSGGLLLDFNNRSWSPEIFPAELVSMRDFERLGHFADSRPIPTTMINDNIQIAPDPESHPQGLVPLPLKPHHSHLSAPPALPTQPCTPLSQCREPPHVLQQVHSVEQPSFHDDMCPRCHHLITGKPRDLSRNVRRHLLLSCPKRDAALPRLSCAVLGCSKTFVRDCAKRVHEEKQHGIVRSGRRRAGKSVTEICSTMNATRVKTVYQDEQMQAASRINEEDFDGAADILTEGMELDLPWNTTRYLVQQFAEELLIATPPATVSTKSLGRIFKLLPDLLRQYATRLTKEEQPQNDQNAVTFVRQNRA